MTIKTEAVPRWLRAHSLLRTLAVALMAVVGALAIAISATTYSAVQLAANAVILMRGTGSGTPTVPFTTNMMNNFVYPTHPELAGYPVSDVNRLYTPEEAWPVTGLRSLTFNESVRVGKNILTSTTSTTTTPTDHVVIFGISQSAVISTEYKRALAKASPGTGPLPGAPDVSFVLAGNLNRPNGGVMMRFAGLYIPILNFTFNGPTPTDTRFPTVDIAQQYDGFADFPNYPINLISDLNAIMGIVYLHPNYGDPANTLVGHPEYQQGPPVGDTTYYLIPTKNLPLLDPIRNISFLKPLVTLIEPALKVIVDAGYDRSISPGTPTWARLIPRVNPITFTKDLIDAIGQGIHDLQNPAAATTPTASVAAPRTAASVTRLKPSRAVAASSPGPAAADNGPAPARLGSAAARQHAGPAAASVRKAPAAAVRRAA